MDWLKKKMKNKKKKNTKLKQRFPQAREWGAKLLEDIIQCCNGKSNPIKFFSADQINKATNNFSVSNRVGSSPTFFGNYYWYSGKIDNHAMIFLVNIEMNRQLRNELPDYARRDYCRDIAISSMVSGHKNFLKLKGCCLEFEEPVTVYNFMKMSHLDIEMVVSWKRRIKIAEDIAIALAYLHTAFLRPFVYRAMNPENIVLDEDGVARLFDFSHCISIPQGETFVQVDTIAGGYGFVDDNYKSSGRVSEKTDVFAFGVFMQMLLIGKKSFLQLVFEKEDGDGIMSKMVQKGLSKSTEEGRMDEIADPKMLEKMDEVGEAEFCQMKAFLMLSLRCVGRTNWEISNMVEVAKELKNIQRSSFPSSNISSNIQRTEEEQEQRGGETESAPS